MRQNRRKREGIASPINPKSMPLHHTKPCLPPCRIHRLFASFVYFYHIPKKCKIFFKNPLTTFDLCDKIINCIIIALTMGNSALRQGSVSMKGDFSRRSLCVLTKRLGARSIRLWPWHLKCPWVVRLTHEVFDVRSPPPRRIRRDLLPLPRRHRDPPDGVPTAVPNDFEWSDF